MGFAVEGSPVYRLLVPVDDADRALAQARYVADLPGAADSVETVLLYVFDPDADGVPKEYQQYKSATRVESVSGASDYLQDRGIETTLLEDSGDAVASILGYADEYDADAIVLGSRKRSPAGKAIFGSVAQDVILGADLPVIVTGDEE